MDLVLSIDVGTSGCRSAVYDHCLRMISCARAEYPLLVKSDTEIEQSADAWWDAVDETARQALAACDAANVRAIGISSQGISVVPVDAAGRALHNAISWLDSRAAAEVDDLVDHFGEEALFQRTGLIPGPLYTLPKIVWMRKNLGPIMEKTRSLLLPMDFLLLRLCGQAATNHTIACGTMMYDIAGRRWDDELLGYAGIDRSMLPEIRNAGYPLGTLLPQVAGRWGVPENVVVAVGAQDQKCAAHGAGVSESVVTVSLGTASCISKLVASLPSHGGPKIPRFAFLDGDRWDVEGIVNTAGSALGWFRDTFAAAQSFADLDRLAEAVDAPGSVSFYPYLANSASPHWGKGAGIFAGLTLNSTVGHCARAVMEGVAYHIRENIDAMDGMGTATVEVRLFGGGAGSDLWCRIIADVVGLPVVRMESADTALAGAARLAFTSLGMPSPPLGIGEVFQPDAAMTARYEQGYEAYEANREKYYHAPDC